MGKICEKCLLKWPTFGYSPGKPRRCKQCKEPDMVDVKNIKCKELGCKSQPSYGFPDGKPICCAKHKVEGMNNLKDNRCYKPGCKKTPCFMEKNTQNFFCYLHSNKNMICSNQILYEKQAKTFSNVKNGSAKYF